MATRIAVAAATHAASTAVSIAFTGTQPVAGNKIVVVWWGFNSASAAPTTITVKDNATSQNSYTQGPVQWNTSVTTAGGVELWWLDLPSNATWSGNYTITVTTTGTNQTSDIDGGAIAYSGAQSGAPTLTHTGIDNGAGSTPASSGAVAGSTGLYVGGATDTSSANPATFTPGGSFTNQFSLLNSGIEQVGVGSDLPEGSGSQTASWTLEASLNWEALIAFWPDVAATTTVQVLRATQKSRPTIGLRARSRLFTPPFTPPPGQMPIVTYAYSAN